MDEFLVAAALCPPGTAYGADTLDARRFGWSGSATEVCIFGAQRGITASPLSDGATVYVGAEDGHMYALSADTGDIAWAVPTGGPIGSSAAISADGTLVFGSNDGGLYALSAQGWDASAAVRRAAVQQPALRRRALLAALAALRRERAARGGDAAALDARSGGAASADDADREEEEAFRDAWRALGGDDAAYDAALREQA